MNILDNNLSNELHTLLHWAGLPWYLNTQQDKEVAILNHLQTSYMNIWKMTSIGKEPDSVIMYEESILIYWEA